MIFNKKPMDFHCCVVIVFLKERGRYSLNSHQSVRKELGGAGFSVTRSSPMLLVVSQ